MSIYIFGVDSTGDCETVILLWDCLSDLVWTNAYVEQFVVRELINYAVIN